MGQTAKGIRNLWMAGAGALALVGCAQGVGTVDRTLPDYVKKADLQGTWYWRDTITQVPPTTALAMIGDYSSLEKVKFVVQQDRLYLYRTYELLPGSYAADVDGGFAEGEQTTAPVASYAITSHFDIQREYNPATGEQTNVISENTTDRPWYEEQYMRVNWGDNIVTNLNTRGSVLSRGGVTDTVRFNGVGSSPTDPRGEFYTEVDKNGSLHYFDFRAHYYVQPLSCAMSAFAGSALTVISPDDCTSADVEITSSFAKVPESDYVPLNFSDQDMTRFPLFRTERLTYDRHYGITEPGWIKLANRFNIWDKIHDAQGNIIPMAQRTPKPILYYTNPQFPADLQLSAVQIQTTFNRAFRRVIAAARLDPGANAPVYDCTVEDEANEVIAMKSDPTHVNRCTDPFSASAPPQMFYVCQTPVPAGAPAACGPAGFAPRIGDLRYSFLYFVQDFQITQPLGMAVISADPETGEQISGGAFLYGASLDSYATDARDLVDVLAGEQNVISYAQGTPTAAYIDNHLNPADPRTWRANAPAEFLNQRVSEPDTSNTPPSLRAIHKAEQDSLRAEGGLQSRFEDPTLRQARWQGFLSGFATAPSGSPLARGTARLQQQAPDLYAQLAGSSELQDAVKALSDDPAVQQQWSQDPFGNLATLMDKSQQRLLDAAKRGVTLADFSDDSVYGLAMNLKDQYFNGVQPNTPEFDAANAATFNAIRNKIYFGLCEHEGAHSFGMRHNFEASFDALNFFPQYWKLRQENLRDESANGFNYGDLFTMTTPTATQKAGRMSEYQYSSAMDYGSRFNTDIHGLGLFDEAALLYTYTGDSAPGMVEVFDYVPPMVASDLPLTPGELLGPTFGARYIFWLFGNRLTPSSWGPVEAVHYTRFPAMMGDGSTFQQKVQSGIANLYKRHLIKWDDLQKQIADNDALLGDAYNQYFTTKDPAATLSALNQRPVQVPYLAASDDYAGFLPDCQLYDQGADYLEQASDFATRYVNYYWMNNYKRNRVGFNEFAVLNKIFQRYFGYFPRSYQSLLFSTPPDNIQALSWELGVYDELNMLANTVATPWYGSYAPTLTPATGQVSNYGLVTTSYVAPSNPARPQMLKDLQASAAENAHLVNLTAANCKQLATTADGAPPHGSSDDVWINWMETLPKAAHDQIPHYYGVNAGEELAFGTTIGVPRWDLATASNRMLGIQEGDGKFPYSQFDGSGGYYYFDKLKRAGHFWDRIAALFALSSSNAQFLGFEFASNVTRFVLPYYSFFPDPLTNFFSGVNQLDHSTLGPRVMFDATGNASGFMFNPMVWHTTGVNAGVNVTHPATPAPTAPVVDVNLNLSDQAEAALNSMATFTNGWNLAYQDANKIYRLGAGESLTPGPGFEVWTYTDAVAWPGHTPTGYSYAAIEPIGATGSAISPAGRMIQDANAAGAVIAVEEPPTEFPTCNMVNLQDARSQENNQTARIWMMNALRQLSAVFGSSQL